MNPARRIDPCNASARSRRRAHLVVSIAAIAFIAVVAQSLAGAAGGQSSTLQPPPPAASTTAPLTEQERRGKSIYSRGESTAGREIVAILGEIDIPGSTLTCAGCHGARAEGKTEGGVTAGDLTWSNLTKSYGHTHPTGRKHGPFNESAVIRATVNGVDPAGNALLAAMPRFRMSPEDMADLIAYLKRVESDRDPGLTDTTLILGTLLPSSGLLAEAGRTARAVTTAYFDEVNSAGGFYGRRVEMRFAETGDTPAATAANLEQFVRSEQPFALVGAFIAGAEREASEIVARHEVPLVGTQSLMGPAGALADRQIFALLPGVAEQSRALVDFAAAKLADKSARVAVVRAENELTATAARAIDERAKKHGWPAPEQIAYARGKLDPASVAAGLKAKGARAVFFLGARDELAFMREAEKLGWLPYVFLLGVMAGDDVTQSPSGFRNKIFLAFPTVPADISPVGAASFRALAQKHDLPRDHVASQISALAAAQVLAEGIKRAGRDLTREKLIGALEGLYDYETGLTPPLTFGPNRRIGAAGAHIVAVDVEKKRYVQDGRWMSAER